MVRFGGLYSRYYKWREGVGPPARRPWTRNYVWGGKETNRVGTREFVDFCRRVGAEPLYWVNFERWRDALPFQPRKAIARAMPPKPPTGCRMPTTPITRNAAQRRAEPFNIKLWQLGNETSYGDATFSKEESIAHTIEFAKAMKERDRSIQLIGWGDRHGNSELWARDLIERAGEHLDFVAIHMMGQSPRRPDTVLKGLRYQKEPERAWGELMDLADNVERRVSELERSIEGLGGRCGIAITEGHLSLIPGNANPILAEWLSAVYHARSFNIYQRHGARVKMAIAADFEGTRWTANAVMLQVPRGVSYLMPVASVAQLFKAHGGRAGSPRGVGPRGIGMCRPRARASAFSCMWSTWITGAPWKPRSP